MSDKYSLISKGSLILVTGANGYIASHVINILLQEGFNVRGTVRAPKPWLNRYFDETYGEGRLETVPVPSMDEPGVWNQVMDGVSGVIHLVSRLTVIGFPQRHTE